MGKEPVPPPRLLPCRATLSWWRCCVGKDPSHPLLPLLAQSPAGPHAGGGQGALLTRSSPSPPTPLQGHTQVVSLLLKHGAAAALQDADGETPLHKAATAGHPEVCRLLLAAAPGAAAARDRHGLTPLQRCEEGSEAAAILRGCEGC